MTTVYDVPATKLIDEAAKRLMEVKEIQAPEWSEFAKTGIHVGGDGGRSQAVGPVGVPDRNDGPAARIGVEVHPDVVDRIGRAGGFESNHRRGEHPHPRG